MGIERILSVRKGIRNVKDIGVERRRWLVGEARKNTVQKTWKK